MVLVVLVRVRGLCKKKKGGMTPACVTETFCTPLRGATSVPPHHPRHQIVASRKPQVAAIIHAEYIATASRLQLQNALLLDLGQVKTPCKK